MARVYVSSSRYNNFVYVFQQKMVLLFSRLTISIGTSSSLNTLYRLAIDGGTLFTRTVGSQVTSYTMQAHSIIQDLSFHSFVAYQLDSTDFDAIYLLCTNTLHGDILTDTTFNSVRIYRYVISTDTWTNLLNPTTGQPQLGMPYDFVNENRTLADKPKETSRP